jgi:hypothetical protein
MILKRIGLVLAGGSLIALAFAVSPAVATHDVPQSASPIHVELVPNFRQTISATQCSARGGAPSTHGSPLALPSCNPPAFGPGTQAHMGNQATSSVDITVIPGDTDPTNGDQADVGLVGSITDVRQGSATGVDYNPVAVGTDMNTVAKIRISDLYNTTGANACSTTTSCDATVQDLDFTVGVPCAATADPSIGSTCSVSTTADAVVPNVTKEGKQAVVQIFRVRGKDAGANGTPGDTDDRDAFMQGIYIP